MCDQYLLIQIDYRAKCNDDRTNHVSYSIFIDNFTIHLKDYHQKILNGLSFWKNVLFNINTHLNTSLSQLARETLKVYVHTK